MGMIWTVWPRLLPDFRKEAKQMRIRANTNTNANFQTYHKAHGRSRKKEAKKNNVSTGRTEKDRNWKAKSGEIMKERERDSGMDADREMKQWEWEYDRRTEKQKQRGWFSTSIPSPFTPLCPLGQLTGNWERWRGELLSRQTNKLAIL